MNFTKFLLWILAIAALGFGLFAFFAYRSSSMVESNQPMAWREFELVHQAHQGQSPILGKGDFGKIFRQVDPPQLPVPNPSRLLALAYLADRKLLVRADVPYWFFRLKGPFVNIALRETGFEMGRLGLSAGQLAEYGSGIVIDDLRRNGDRILIWLE